MSHASDIAAHLPPVPVPLIPDIRLHMAERKAQLDWLPADGPPPYWAYVWAGGAAAARHLLAHPELVRGRRVLDLGSGSGIVGIAAAMSGAAVLASEIDPIGRTAVGMNAEANGVSLTVTGDDVLPREPPSGLDLVLVGDMLYERHLAAAVIPFLYRCRAAGLEIILGDPGRGYLPRNRLRVLAHYGKSLAADPDGPTTPAAVYAFE